MRNKTPLNQRLTKKKSKNHKILKHIKPQKSNKYSNFTFSGISIQTSIIGAL